MPGHWEVRRLRNVVSPDSVKAGYGISFTRYFYLPQPLRVRTQLRERIRQIRSFMANCSPIEMRGRQECMRRENALPLATGHCRCVYAVTGDEGAASEEYGLGYSNGVLGAQTHRQHFDIAPVIG